MTRIFLDKTSPEALLEQFMKERPQHFVIAYTDENADVHIITSTEDVLTIEGLLFEALVFFATDDIEYEDTSSS